MVDTTQLFSDMERKYNLPAGYLNRTYQIESNSGQNLFNKKSGAAGPFQFIPSTAKAYGLSDPYDINASAEAAARLAADNRSALEAAGIKNPSAAHLYLAHQQGAGGASGLLNSDKPASSVVGERAVAWNGGKPEQTGSDFASGIMNKFNTGFSSGEPIAPSPVGYAQLQSGMTGLLGAKMPAQVAGPMQTASMSMLPQTGSMSFASMPQGLLDPAKANTQVAQIQPQAPAPSADAQKDFDYAKLAGAGISMMASAAPKATAVPAPMGQIHRPQVNPQLFAGLLRKPWNV